MEAAPSQRASSQCSSDPHEPLVDVDVDVAAASLSRSEVGQPTFIGTTPIAAQAPTATDTPRGVAAVTAATTSPIALFAGGPLTLAVAAPFTHADGCATKHSTQHTAAAAATVPEDRAARQKKQRLEMLSRGSAIKLKRTATHVGHSTTGPAGGHSAVNSARGEGHGQVAVTAGGAGVSPTSGSSTAAAAAAAPTDGQQHRQQQKGVRVTLAPAALLAAHTTDPREWVLPIRKPKIPRESARLSTTTPGERATTTTKTNVEGDAADTDSETGAATANNTLPASSQSPQLAVVPALEEKLTLTDLRRIMYGFASETAVTDAELLDQLEKEATTQWWANPKTRRHTPQAREQSIRQEEEAGTAAAAVPRVLDRPLPGPTELTSFLLLGTAREGSGRREAKKLRDGENAVSEAYAAPHGGPSRRAEATTPRANAAASFERVLSADEFVALMRSVLAANPMYNNATSSSTLHGDCGEPHPPGPARTTQAHDEEIRHLLNKVDYDGRGRVSWDELATFFISQSRQRTHLSQLHVQYSARPDPATYASVLKRHQRGITCYTSHKGRKVLLTGSADGTVHAWGTRSLVHRGLVFACPEAEWVVGVHLDNSGRALYITTMNRKVYVLEGNTFEVLRSFQGRAVDDGNASIVYAHDTTRVVRVGGSVPPPPPPLPQALASAVGADKLGAEERGLLQRQQRFLRKKAAESMGGLASLRTGGQDDGAASAMAVMTTALAYETLDLDNAQVTARGTGPYAERRVQEDAIVGLVDAVTATAFHYSALDEDTLLLGTSAGDVYLVVIPSKAATKVVVPKHVLRQVHTDRINKLEIVPAMDSLMSCADDGRVVMTSLVTGQPLRVFHAPGVAGQHVAVRDFAVNAPLRMVVSVGPERSGLVWDFAQYHPVAVLDAHNSACQSCAIVAPTDALAATTAAAAATAGGGGAAAATATARVDAAHPPSHIMTVGVDGSIHVFDVNGYHRVQTISVGGNPHGAAASGGGGGQVNLTTEADSSNNNRSAVSKTSESACDADHVPRLLVPEGKQRSVLCFSRYVYRLHMKRQVTATCPARYCGPNALMLSILYTRSFDLLVTVDADAMAMTWHRTNGKSVFAFSLSEFSDSAAMNATRLTAVALDGQQPRMLTGFRNGAVVVWNVMNGQAINFVTAGMSEERGTALARPAGVAAAADSGASLADGSSGGHEVTAIASFIRHDIVFLVFAVGRTVYVVQEDATTFTIANAFNSWTLPAAYGAVNALLQVSPQSMACGTSSGALLFFHVLSGQQEGAVLWVTEGVTPPPPSAAAIPSSTPPVVLSSSLSTPPPQQQQQQLNGNDMGSTTGGVPRTGTRFRTCGSTAAPSATTAVAGHPTPTVNPAQTTTTANNFNNTSSRLRSIGLLLDGSHAQRLDRVESLAGPSAAIANGNGNAAALPFSPAAAVVTARIVKLVALAHVHPHLLLSVHMDGTVALWHSLRRVYLGSVSLSAAANASHNRRERRSSASLAETLAGAGSTGGGVDENANNDVDESDVPTIVVDVNARNNTLVFADDRGSVHICDVAFRALDAGSEEERQALALPNPAWYSAATRDAAAQAGEQASPPSSPPTRSSPVGNGGDPIMKKPPARDVERELFVFDHFTQLRTFPTGLTAINGVLVIDPVATAQPKEEKEKEEGEGDGTCDSSSSSSSGRDEPVIVCCSSESQYSRVFSFDGLPIGEPGMDLWDVHDKRTFHYLGEPVCPRAQDDLAEVGGPDPAPFPGELPDEREESAKTEAAEGQNQSTTPQRTSWASEAFFDFLEEGYAAYQQQQHALIASLRRVHSSRSFAGAGGGGNARASRFSLATGVPAAAAALASAHAAPPHARSPSAMMAPSNEKSPNPEPAEGPTRPTTTTTTTTVASPTPLAQVPLVVPMKQFYNTSARHSTYASADRGGSTATTTPRERIVDSTPISTLMTRNTKDTRTYGQVLKPAYAHQVRLERRLRKQQEHASSSHVGNQATTGGFPMAFNLTETTSNSSSSDNSNDGSCHSDFFTSVEEDADEPVKVPTCGTPTAARPSFRESEQGGGQRDGLEEGKDSGKGSPARPATCPFRAHRDAKSQPQRRENRPEAAATGASTADPSVTPTVTISTAATTPFNSYSVGGDVVAPLPVPTVSTDSGSVSPASASANGTTELPPLSISTSHCPSSILRGSPGRVPPRALCASIAGQEGEEPRPPQQTRTGSPSLLLQPPHLAVVASARSRRPQYHSILVDTTLSFTPTRIGAATTGGRGGRGTQRSEDTRRRVTQRGTLGQLPSPCTSASNTPTTAESPKQAQQQSTYAPHGGIAGPRRVSVSDAPEVAAGSGTTAALPQRREIEELLDGKRAEVLRNLGGPDGAAASMLPTDAAILTQSPTTTTTGAASAAATSSLPGTQAHAGTGLAKAPPPSTTATSARSFLAAVSSRMYVAPVEELEPPVGSRSREEAKAWREHLRRLEDSKLTAASTSSATNNGGNGSRLPKRR